MRSLFLPLPMKILFALILASLCVASRGAPSELHFVARDSEATFEKAWVLFKAEHDKTYGSVEEEHHRRKVFAENLKEIESHNYLYEMGLTSYQKGVNTFTDMESSELEKLTGLKMTDDITDGIAYLPLNDFVLPESVDWRPKGYVTPVKDQKMCGSCWAFSATGSLEGQTFRKTSKLISLSEQNLVDCSRSYGNMGCNGGRVSESFDYIKENGGIDTEISYPYTAKDGICQYKKENKGATVAGMVMVKPGNETMLTEAVATIGPVSVGINVTHAFHEYSKGIYDDALCTPAIGGHALLIVGYGSDNGEDYWIVKNSWGAKWGENGYIRMARNKNICGITADPVYPLV